MEEPSALIRWVIFFFAGGDAATAGLMGIATIAILCLFTTTLRTVRRLYVVLAVAVSLLLIICGSLPVPLWFEILSLIWLMGIFQYAGLRRRAATDQDDAKYTRFRRRLYFCSFAWVCAVIAFDLPMYCWQVPTNHVSELLVIGDSVTAGLNDGEDTWPQRLSRAAEVNVIDASQPGATLSSARQQNLLFAGCGGDLVLEIGGNDMLEGLPVARFEEDLDRLLSEAVQAGRIVTMFELPLPPLCAAYGAVQRRQAKRHQVNLVPKRSFAKVLTTAGATVDGIHLSAIGQSQMMEMIRSFFSGRLRAGQGTYERLERTSITTVMAP